MQSELTSLDDMRGVTIRNQDVKVSQVDSLFILGQIKLTTHQIIIAKERVITITSLIGFFIKFVKGSRYRDFYGIYIDEKVLSLLILL